MEQTDPTTDHITDPTQGLTQAVSKFPIWVPVLFQFLYSLYFWSLGQSSKCHSSLLDRSRLSTCAESIVGPRSYEITDWLLIQTLAMQSLSYVIWLQ